MREMFPNLSYFSCIYASPTRVASPIQRILESGAWHLHCLLS